MNGAVIGMFNLTRNTPKTPSQQRTMKLFYISLIGAGLLLIGPILDFAKGSADASGYGEVWSDSIKGTEKYGVGWWPFVLGALAVGLLFLTTLTDTLPIRALQIGAGALGLWVAIYDWMRLDSVRSLVSDKADEAGAGYGISFDANVSGKIGFYVILLGALVIVGVASTMLYLGFQDSKRAMGAPMALYGGAPYGAQPYGNQPYGNQPYGQQYGQPPYGNQPYGGQAQPPYPPAEPPPQAYPTPPPVEPPYVSPGPPPSAGPPPYYQPPPPPPPYPPAEQGPPPLPPASPTYGGRR